jgi:hypothetical protein
MLWAAGDGPRPFTADLLRQVLVGAPRVDAERLWSGNPEIHVSARCIQRSFESRPSYGRATSRSSLFAAINSPSRVFQLLRTSADGAHPRMPGWMSPANLTWGMCRLVQ